MSVRCFSNSSSIWSLWISPSLDTVACSKFASALANCLLNSLLRFSTDDCNCSASAFLSLMSFCRFATAVLSSCASVSLLAESSLILRCRSAIFFCASAIVPFISCICMSLSREIICTSMFSRSRSLRIFSSSSSFAAIENFSVINAFFSCNTRSISSFRPDASRARAPFVWSSSLCRPRTLPFRSNFSAAKLFVISCSSRACFLSISESFFSRSAVFTFSPCSSASLRAKACISCCDTASLDLSSWIS